MQCLHQPRQHLHTPSLPACTHAQLYNEIQGWLIREAPALWRGFELALIDRRNSLCCLHPQRSSFTTPNTTAVLLPFQQREGRTGAEGESRGGDLCKRCPLWAHISDHALILFLYIKPEMCSCCRARHRFSVSEEAEWKLKAGSRYITELLYNYWQNCSPVRS